MQMLRMSGALPLLPLSAFKVWRGVTVSPSLHFTSDRHSARVADNCAVLNWQQLAATVALSRADGDIGGHEGSLMKITIIIFWDVTPCSLVQVGRLYE